MGCLLASEQEVSQTPWRKSITGSPERLNEASCSFWQIYGVKYMMRE